METTQGTYLGSYKIRPNSVEIEVDCYGEVNPAQRQTLEQEGIPAHVILERVEQDGFDITDFLCDDDLEKLDKLCNEKPKY